MKMKYCKKCLQPNTRPGVKFDENGICYACKFEEEKKNIDWDKREEELREIANWAKETSKGPYDCIVGVSGGKDSTFQALYVKEKLGLNVLLVNSTPDNITEIGRQNLDNLCKHGFDMINLRPNPKVAKHLAKKGFFEYGNIAKGLEIPLCASAFIIADKFDIPLIIEGENAAMTLGTVETGQALDDSAYSWVDLDTIQGGRKNNLIDDTVNERDLYLFDFPNIEEMQEKGIRAIWLQYYAKEWSQVYNAEFSAARGLKGRGNEDLHELGRYRIYTALDVDWVIPNQMLKYYKFGFGFATDEACYDIREERISREEGTWLIEEYDGKCGEKYIKEFCDYIDITVKEFWEHVDNNIVNKDLFKKDEKTGKWIPKFKIGEDFEY